MDARAARSRRVQAQRRGPRWRLRQSDGCARAEFCVVSELRQAGVSFLRTVFRASRGLFWLTEQTDVAEPPDSRDLEGLLFLGPSQGRYGQASSVALTGAYGA